MNSSLQSIAAECHVSAMTVSRALDPAKRALLAPETCRRVLAVIEKYGYEGNASARRLKRGTSEMLTLVLPPRPVPAGGRSIFDAFTEARTLAVMKAALAEARMQRYEIKLEASLLAGDCDEIIRTLKNTRTDGVLLQTGSELEPVLDYLGQMNIPHLIMRTHAARDVYSSPRLRLDAAPGIRAALTRLVRDGHRRVAFLQHRCLEKKEMNAVMEETAKQLGIYDPELFFTCDSPTGLADMAERWSRELPCSAVFCSNDCRASLLCEFLRGRGVRIPEMLSVVGFDDNPMFPALSTVRQPLEEMAAKAVQLLLARIRGEKILLVMDFQTSFIQRTTSGKVR